jgi:hypothetical protein
MSVGEMRDSVHGATSLAAALAQVPGAEVARVLRDVLRTFQNQHGGDGGMTFAAALGCALLEAASEDYDGASVIGDVRRSALSAVATAARARKFHQAFTRRHLTGGHSVVPTLMGHLDLFGSQRGVLMARDGTQVTVTIAFTGCEEKAGPARNSPLLFRLGVELRAEDMQRLASPSMAAAFVSIAAEVASEKRRLLSSNAEMVASDFLAQVDERVDGYDREAVKRAALAIASSAFDIAAFEMFNATTIGAPYRLDEIERETVAILASAVDALTLIACNRGGKPRAKIAMHFAPLAEGIVACLQQYQDELEHARARNDEGSE